MAQVVSALDVCLFGAALYIIKKLVDLRTAKRLPPGPTGWPIIGSLLNVPSERTWLAFAALGRKYGDVSSLSILGTRYVLLNSHKAVSEILEKQSAKSSDRPHLTMADELVGWKNSLLFIMYNDRFRASRRLLSRLFGSRSSTSAFYPIVEEETKRFVRNVVKQPDALLALIRTTAGAIILMMIYGYPVKDTDDPLVDLADRTMENLSMVSAPGAFLVDLIPALRHLPEWFAGAGFLRDAKRYRALVMETLQKPHKYVIEQMAAGTAIPSFTSKLLDAANVTPEEEDIIMWTAFSTYLGGADTVVSSLYSFFLAMIIYPEVQEKAQTELDAVIGTERFPSLDDRDSLPYINAICKEVLRWHLVAPLGMPHVATEDVYCSGYLIPKGSIIIGNAWAILHDESVYPDPHVFRPERFLGSNPQPDPHIACFGYGRRVCPGLHLAEANIFMSVAMSLATLKISRAILNGAEVIPELDVTSGTVSHPKPFEYRITPRSARVESLLQH